MTYQQQDRQGSLFSVSSQASKKNDILMKIQRMEMKQKWKLKPQVLIQSPHSLNSYNLQSNQTSFFPRRLTQTPKAQNQIISNLRADLMTIKSDVSKLMGQKEAHLGISSSSKRLIKCPKEPERQFPIDGNYWFPRANTHNLKIRPGQMHDNSATEAISGLYSEILPVSRSRQRDIASKDIWNRDCVEAISEFGNCINYRSNASHCYSPRLGSGIHLAKDLQDAKRTIRNLEGAIEDSSLIRKGLEMKISSLKRDSAKNGGQDTEDLVKQLNEERSLRLALEARVSSLTNQIDSINQQMQDQTTSNWESAQMLVTGDKSRSRAIDLQAKYNPSRVDSSQSRMDEMQKSHRRQMMGLATELKLCKLVMERKQREQDQVLRVEQDVPRSDSYTQIDLQKDTCQEASQAGVQTEVRKQEPTPQDLQQRMSRMALEKKDMQHHLHLLTTQKGALQHQLNSTHKKEEQTRKSLQQLNRDYSNLKQDNQELQKQHLAVQQRLQQYNKQVNEQIQRLLLQTTSQSTEIQRLQELVDTAQEERQLAQEQARDFSGQFAAKDRAIKELTGKHLQLQSQLRDLKQRHRMDLQSKDDEVLALSEDNRRLDQLNAEKCRPSSQATSRDLDLQFLKIRNQQLHTSNQLMQVKLQEQQQYFQNELSLLKLQLKPQKHKEEDFAPNFDQSLRSHLQELSHLKLQGQEKNELVIQLQEELRQSRSTVDNMRAESQIEKLKGIAERKNLYVSFQVQLQNIRNQLNFEKRTSDSVTTKFKLLNEQNRRKDQFLQKYILGKSISPEFKVDVTEFFSRYQQQFHIQRLKERVYQEVRHIQRLTEQNQLLNKDICWLRRQQTSQEALALGKEPEVPFTPQGCCQEGTALQEQLPLDLDMNSQVVVEKEQTSIQPKQ